MDLGRILAVFEDDANEGAAPVQLYKLEALNFVLMEPKTPRPSHHCIRLECAPILLYTKNTESSAPDSPSARFSSWLSATAEAMLAPPGGFAPPIHAQHL